MKRIAITILTFLLLTPTVMALEVKPGHTATLTIFLERPNGKVATGANCSIDLIMPNNTVWKDNEAMLEGENPGYYNYAFTAPSVLGDWRGFANCTWNDYNATSSLAFSVVERKTPERIVRNSTSNTTEEYRLLNRAQEDIMKEQQRTREDVRDAKRIILKNIREAVFAVFGIKKPEWLPSSSSSSTPQTAVNSSSEKSPQLPTGRAIKSPEKGTPKQVWDTITEIYSRGVNVVLWPVRQAVGG